MKHFQHQSFTPCNEKSDGFMKSIKYDSIAYNSQRHKCRSNKSILNKFIHHKLILHKGISCILACTWLLLLGSCSKVDDPIQPIPIYVAPPVIPPVVPPQIPAYTVVLIKRLEEEYVQSNPNVTNRTRDYTFYYDSQKRVIKVGIKNYGPVSFDSATTYLSYANGSSKPDIIVTPNIRRSPYGSPVNYDTTWFTYNPNGQITSDSSMQEVYDAGTSSYIPRPMVRYYSYPNSSKTYIQWYAPSSATGTVSRIRCDTLTQTSGKAISNLKTVFLSPSPSQANYALGEGFTYSAYANPLSQLNISGTHFSLIYTSMNTELLGNSSHKAVHNSNILPYYVDFISPKIPSTFYIGGFTPGGFLIASTYDGFNVRITPWSVKPEYPSEISVGASTALEARFVYRYFY